MEDTIDSNYNQAKRVCRDFEIQNLGEYHDLYLKSNALLLADVFKNFRKMCLDIYELNPGKLVLGPGLAWKANFKKTKVELELLSDTGN